MRSAGVNEATSKVFTKNESLEKIVVKDISTQDLDVNVSFDADNIILGDEDLLVRFLKYYFVFIWPLINPKIMNCFLFLILYNILIKLKCLG